jgi:hypothetical protein
MDSARFPSQNSADRRDFCTAERHPNKSERCLVRVRASCTELPSLRFPVPHRRRQSHLPQAATVKFPLPMHLTFTPNRRVRARESPSCISIPHISRSSTSMNPDRARCGRLSRARTMFTPPSGRLPNSMPSCIGTAARECCRRRIYATSPHFFQTFGRWSPESDSGKRSPAPQDE